MTESLPTSVAGRAKVTLVVLEQGGQFQATLLLDQALEGSWDTSGVVSKIFKGAIKQTADEALRDLTGRLALIQP